MNEKLKAVLNEKGIKQKELAEAVGVSEPFITYLIKGYKQPSVTLLKRMADFLQVKMDDLI